MSSELLSMPPFVEAVICFAFTTGILTVLFRNFPHAPNKWSSVWVGAFATATLFDVGRSAPGFHIPHGNFGYCGTAVSVIVVLIRIYCAAQTFLYGGEFTKAYAGALCLKTHVTQIMEG